MSEQSRDREVVERWYRQHGAALLLFGSAMTGDRARAQDALHQVFLRLLEHPGTRIIDERRYLFSALRNALLNDAKRRHRDVPIDCAWFEAPTRGRVDEVGLRQALLRLPAEQREVAVLHVWGGLTFAEVADVLGINANTAAARYRYALAKLRESMAPLKEEEHVRREP